MWWSQNNAKKKRIIIIIKFRKRMNLSKDEDDQGRGTYPQCMPPYPSPCHCVSTKEFLKDLTLGNL